MRPTRSGQRLADPVAAFGQIAPHLPKPPQRRRQLLGQRTLLGGRGISQGRPGVVVIGFDQVEPIRDGLFVEPRLGLLRQCEVGVGVALAQLVLDSALVESLEGELLDRLEEQESGPTRACRRSQQSLVDEVGKPFEQVS